MKLNNFTMMDNRIIEDERTNLSHLAIYLILAKFADNKTRSCYPSYNTIASLAKCARNTVIKIVKELVELGYVIKHEKTTGAKNAHACNLYILPVVVEQDVLSDNETSAPVEPPEEITAIKNAADLPKLREAFPEAKPLLDVIEQYSSDSSPVLPSANKPLPSAQPAPELNPLNYNPLNYNLSDRSPYGSREEILEKLDRHFKYFLFGNDDKLREPYRVITGYMADMLTFESTRIGGQNLDRDELGRYIFGMSAGTLSDFLEYIQSISFDLDHIRKPQAYFKTTLIEYLRQNNVLYGGDRYFKASLALENAPFTPNAVT